MFDGVTIEVVSKKKGWPLRFTNIFGHVSLGHRYVTGWGFFFTKGSYNHVIILSVEFFYENIHISYLFGNVLTHNAHVVHFPSTCN